MTYASPTSINASKGFIEILNYVNAVTNNWISTMILLAVYVIVLIGYYKSTGDFAGGLASAGFGAFVVGLLFWMGGFVTGWALSICVAVLLLGIMAVLMNKR